MGGKHGRFPRELHKLPVPLRENYLGVYVDQHNFLASGCCGR